MPVLEFAQDQSRNSRANILLPDSYFYSRGTGVMMFSAGNYVFPFTVLAPKEGGLMYINNRFISTFLGFLLLFLGIQPSASAGNSYSSLVVFGDSLSDPGNAWILTRNQSKAPFDIIPSAPYAIGGHHFSNGQTWIEQLAEKLGTDARPAYRFSGGTNYAVGGARAGRPGNTDLTAQVNLDLDMSVGGSDPNALYVIAIGGNDVRDAIQAYATDPSGATSGYLLHIALKSICRNLSNLAESGAHHFLVSTAPDLGLVPAVRLQGPQVQFLANTLSAKFNAGLAYKLAKLKQKYGLDLKVLDLYGLIDNAVGDPAQFNLKVVGSTCIRIGVVAQSICSQPQGYLFWDGIHPTRAGHAIIRNKALALVKG
jgi:phospholipase/lecithinase/hemolysin